jgi:hypothetical protein
MISTFYTIPFVMDRPILTPLPTLEAYSHETNGI